jgi:hypothetical protein
MTTDLSTPNVDHTRHTHGEFGICGPERRVSMPSQTGDQGNGHPVLFGFAPALQYVAMPDGGGYPIGFLERAYSTLGVTNPDRVLHLCSGSLRVGVRVDIRSEMEPDIVADCRAVPLPDESFDWIMADPPYSEQYAANLYGTAGDYPAPSQILKEASRLLRPGGTVGLLHFQVPMHRPPLQMVGVWGVSTGAGYAIRAWTVFRKAQQTLGLVA